LRNTRQKTRRSHGGFRPVLAVVAVSIVGAAAAMAFNRANMRENSDGPVDRIVGRAVVADGDTVEIARTRIRFNGIDAPEMAQKCTTGGGQAYRCGVEAARALDRFLSQSRPLRCEFVEWDQYGRFVGNCFRNDGVNVAQWLVRNGYAVDWPRYSAGRYAGDQSLAREERLGLWGGRFDLPWEWRAREGARKSDPAPPASALGNRRSDENNGGCRIKGNINRQTGAKYYHLPGQRDYEKTRISVQRGERWFCSESEARAAGWRRAGG
jgi:endonuclease YncB( thermonuclease family)